MRGRLLVNLGVVLSAMGACHHARWRPDDRAIVARFERSDPCPTPIPALWQRHDPRPDPALAQSTRCSLIAATVRHIEQSADTSLRNGVARAVCIGVHTFTIAELPAQTSGEAYWTIEFVGPTGDAIGAGIDRLTGVVTLRHFPNEFASPVSQICGRDA